MAPDAVKCPDCGSTQIGSITKGGGISSSFGYVSDDGAAVGQHAKTPEVFYNACQACGYEWSPAAATAANIAWEQKRAYERALAARKAIFIPWRKKLLGELRPLLKAEKYRHENRHEFSEWLENDYINLKQTTKNELEEKINGVTLDNHPWLLYKNQKHSKNMVVASLPFMCMFFLCMFFLVWPEVWNPMSGSISIGLVILSFVILFAYPPAKKQITRRQFESFYQSDGSQQIDSAPTRGRRQRQRAPSEEATTGSSKSSPRRSPPLFFVKKKGHAARRLSSSELRTAVGNREFAPDDRIRKSKKDKWTTLSTVKGLDFPKPS